MSTIGTAEIASVNDVLRRHVTVTAIMLAFVMVASQMAFAQSMDLPKRGTRVSPGEANKVFVMAGFAPSSCAFIGFPEMQIEAAPAKGAVSFKQGETTTIQYSLSGNCVGNQVQGTGIYYTPVAGQTGADTFSVSGRLGTGEPATRTFSVIIDENGNPE